MERDPDPLRVEMTLYAVAAALILAYLAWNWLAGSL